MNFISKFQPPCASNLAHLSSDLSTGDDDSDEDSNPLHWEYEDQEYGVITGVHKVLAELVIELTSKEPKEKSSRKK
ncbi:hypothetical protein XA68_10445 [Ophiocordyceps unilateralis]|uniref:Uncharacterized protein n=1 Tax=Ophiocordyceps unilateralis TaxID=268505 RepID=A0A2A9PIN1_OPHUN|nr:hypothetical protein XA68_10445 [Ophiocordyceps unilateralis]